MRRRPRAGGGGAEPVPLEGGLGERPGLAEAVVGRLVESVDPVGRRLRGRALTRRVVLAMIKRRAAAAGLPPSNVLPPVPGDGDHGVSVERGDP